jgi:hypothetical protein
MKTARITVVLLAAIAISIVLSVPSEAAEKRLALIIGNADYKNEKSLKNPINDANDMEKTLKSLGFVVIARLNAGKKEMVDIIREFGNLLKKNDIGLFYFAGHGIQHNGHNYLIPTDADIRKETDLEFETVNAGRILAEMTDAGNRMNIVILDACRNNPFLRSFRSATRGLAKMDAPKGTLIAYATSPNDVAEDGKGRNGTYTANLLKYMTTPGLPVELVFKRVRNGVIRDSSNQQVPWEATSLSGEDFYFAAAQERSDESRDTKPDPPPVKKPSVSQKQEPVQPEQQPKYNLRSSPMTTDSSSDFKSSKGIKNEFQVNGDTITDNATGLMWQKSGSPNHMNYDNAKAYIEELNSKNFAGYSDWRLPTVDELTSLLTPEKQSNDLYINPIFDKTQWGCWTSDQRASGGAWLVYFTSGNVYWYGGTSYVRAVRLRQ